MKDKISKYLKKYLRWAKFSVECDSPRYKKLLLFDVIIALIYTFTSIALICIEATSLIALWINILCLVRALIDNVISAAETPRIRGDDGREYNNYHYHLKATALLVSIIFLSVTFLSLLIESSSNVNGLVKISTIIILLLLYANDCDNAIICAYNATA